MARKSPEEMKGYVGPNWKRTTNVKFGEWTLKGNGAYAGQSPAISPFRSMEGLQMNMMGRGAFKPAFPGMYHTREKYMPVEPKENLYLDYNDPFAINSMADVFLTTFNKDMKRNDWGGLEKIPILNMITGTVDLTINSTIKPLLKGEPTIAMLNGITNFGETMDAVANPVKALAQGYGLEGVKDSLGWGTNGRKNYDYDTGNLAGDIFLELISDPLNWISFGGSTAAKSAGKNMSEQMLKNMAKEGIEGVEEKTIRDISRKAMKSWMKGDKESIVEATDGLLRRFGKTMSTTMEQDMYRKMSHVAATTAEEFQALSILKATRTLVSGAEALETGLMKAALKTTAVFPAWKVGKTGYDAVFQRCQNRFIQQMKPYLIEDSYFNVFKFEEGMKEYHTLVQSQNLLSGLTGFKIDEADMIKMFDTSIDHNIHFIEDLLDKCGTDMTKFNEELRKYFDVTDEEPMKAFVEHVTNLNDVIGDNFRDTVQRVDMLADAYEDILAKANRDVVHKTVQAQYDAVDNVLDDIIGTLAVQRRDISTGELIKNKATVSDKEITPAFAMGSALSENVKSILSQAEDQRWKFKYHVDNNKLHQLDEKFYLENDLIDDKALREVLVSEIYDYVNSIGESLLTRYGSPDMHPLFLEYLNKTLYAMKDFINKEVRHLNGIKTSEKLMEYSIQFAKELEENMVKLAVDYKTKMGEVLELYPQVHPTRGTHKAVEEYRAGKMISAQFTNTVNKYKGSPNLYPTTSEGMEYINRINDIKISLGELTGSDIQKYYETNKLSFKVFTKEDVVALQHFMDLKPAHMLTGTLKRMYHGTRLETALKNLDQFNKEVFTAFGHLETELQKISDKITSGNNNLLELSMADALIQSEIIDKAKGIAVAIGKTIDKGTPEYKKVVRTLTQAKFKALKAFPGEGIITLYHSNKPKFHKFSEFEAMKIQRFLDSTPEDIWENPSIFNNAASAMLKLEIDINNMRTRVPKGTPTFDEFRTKRLAELQAKEPKDAFEAALEYTTTNTIVNEYNIYESYQIFLKSVATKGLNMDYQAFEGFRDVISGFRIKEALEPMVECKAGGIDKQLKVEHSYASIALTEIESIVQLNEMMNNNTGVGKFINSTADYNPKEFPQMAQLIQDCRELTKIMDNFNNFRRFMHKLHNMDMPKEHVTAIISTLHNFYKLKPEVFLRSPDYFIDDVIKRAENFMHTPKQSKSVSLESLMKENDGLIKNRADAKAEEYGLKVGKSHNAAYDVLVTEEVIKEYLPDAFTNPNVKYVVLDIETTGLRSDVSTVFEVACKELGSNEAPVDFYNKLDVNVELPPQNVINKMVQRPELTDAQAREVFRKMYCGKKEDGNEFAMLSKMLDYIRSLQEDGKTIQIIGHNSAEFDLKYLVDRMRLWGIDGTAIRNFQNAFVHDTRVMLDDAMGKVRYTAYQRRQVRKTVLRYVQQQSDLGVPYMMQAASGDLAGKLLDVYHSGKKIVDSKTSLPVDKTDLMEQLQYLHGASSDLSAELTNIATTNRNLGNLFLEGVNFENGNYLDFLRDFIQENAEALTKTTGLGKDALLERLGTHVNSSKLLYGFSGSGLPYYGVSNSLNWDMMNLYMNLPKELPLKRAKELSALTKKIENLKLTVKNTAPLGKHMKDLKRMLDTLIPDLIADPKYYTQGTAKPMLSQFFAYLKKDPADLLTTYAEVQYLYNIAKRNKPELFKMATKGVDGELLTLLDNPRKYLGHREHSYGAMNFMESGDDIEFDPLISKAEELKMASSQLRGMGKDLTEFGDALDDAGLYTPKTQAVSSVLESTADLVENYAERIGNLATKSDKKQYYMKLVDDTNNMAINATKQILELNPEDMFKHLITRCFSTFVQVPIKDLGKTMSHANIINNREAYEALGMYISIQDGMFRVGIDNTKVRTVLRETEDGFEYYINGNKIDAPELKDIVTTGVDEFHADLELSKARIRHLTKGSDVGSLGDNITPLFFKELYEKLPEDILKMMPPSNSVMNHPAFKMANNFNFINLGSIRARREFQPYLPTMFINIQKSFGEQTAIYAKPKMLYTDMFFSKAMSVNSIIEGKRTPEDIYQALTRTSEYILSALEQTDKGPKMVMLKPKSFKQFNSFLKMNPVILPYQTASRAMQVINHDKMSNKVLNALNKFLLATKMGFLVYPGVWMRNYVDSTMKNMNDTKSGFAEVASYQIKATKLLSMYDDTVRMVMNMDDLGRFTTENLNQYFALYSKPDYDLNMFMAVDSFIKDGPSAGMSQSWLDAYSARGKEVKNAMADLTGLTQERDLFDTFMNFSSMLMEPNKKVEQINRLAELLILMDRGLNTTSIYAKIAHTHFDYAMKSEAGKILEYIFPFYTFTVKNLQYWLDAVENNGWIFGALANTMNPVWDFDSYDKDEVAFNKSLQYQILSGNVPIGENGMTIKLSSSFMDAYKTVMNPMEEVQGKMLPQLQMLTSNNPNETILNTALPVISPLVQKGEQSSKYYDRTGNLLNRYAPGIFGATSRWKEREEYPNITPHNSGLAKKLRYEASVGAKARSGKGPRRRGGRVRTPKFYPRKQYNKWYYPKNIRVNIYNNLYTSKGQSRIKLAMNPTNVHNLAGRVQGLSDYNKYRLRR